MTPRNITRPSRNITRPGLPAASTLLVPVALGILILGMISQTARSGPQGSQEFVFKDGPQPKSAAYNKVSMAYLQAEYRLYQRCLAQGRPFAPECPRLTQEAVEAYNQVAGDTDPSAFDLTGLPRHLEHPAP